MNNNLFISSFLSIVIHVLLFFIPLRSISLKDIDIDMIRMPASIEISMVRRVPIVEVKDQKIDKVESIEKIEKEDSLPETKSKQKNIMDSKSMIGAITEQISTLMINKPPIYPTVARIKGWEGEIILVAIINIDGKVSNVDILLGSDFYVLDMAAVKAIKTWQFRNVTKPVRLEIPVKFVLTEN